MFLREKEFNLSSEDLERIYLNKSLKKNTTRATPSIIQDLYGEFIWPHFSNKRKMPYLYGSLIQTLNGKLFLVDQKANGISRLNHFNPKGYDVDFWILNVLRFYSDAIIIGSETLRKQPHLTSHIWDKQLVELRKTADGKVPIHIVITETGLLRESSRILMDSKIPLIFLTTYSGLQTIKGISQRRIKTFFTKEGKFSKENLRDHIVIFVVETTRKEEIIINFLEDLALTGIQKVLLESPTLINYLIKWQILDEIFLATNNVITERGSQSSYAFSLDVLNHSPHAKLMSLHQSKGFYLFSRFQLLYHSFL